MITVGLIKELYFIASVLKQDVTVHLRLGKIDGTESRPITIQVSVDAILNIYYSIHHIWTERIEGDVHFFGVESCDTISRIVACIDNGSYWQGLAYYEKD